MSGKRAPSAPPRIPGFEHVSLIGSGGFSDVFLYEQQRPRRRVAVKVLLHEWSNPSQRAAFDGEADLMARLSTHPSIVTIYEADVAPDGRPYLAMEYCSRPSLGTRYRAERLGLAECLRVVVQIAGAVETAHRAGILHRDIKPANILGTDYGHPVLTDFGISSTLDDVARAEGLSIPWSPPESFEDPPRAGIGTDVWALGATLYTFLAGRSPFEAPGRSNSSADLVQRIVGQPLEHTGRSDVPASLENVLATSMAKSPSARYPSVLDFARAVQQVQIELAHGVTPVDILGDTGVVQHSAEPDDEDDDDPGTRLRGVVSIDPSGAPAPAPRQSFAAPAPVAQPGADVPPTQVRPTAQPVPPAFVRAPQASAPAPAAPTRVALVDPAGPGPRATTTGAGQRATTTGAGQRATTPEPAPPSPAVAGFGQQAPLEDTVLRPEAPTGVDEWLGQDEIASERVRKGPGRVVAGVVGIVLAVGLVGGGAFYLLSGGGSPSGQHTSATDKNVSGSGDAGGGSGPHDNIGGIVPPVKDLKVSQVDKGAKKATFTWKPTHAQQGDQYGWGIIDPLKGDPPMTETSQKSVTVPLGHDGNVCVEVVMVRSGSPSASPQRACAASGK